MATAGTSSIASEATVAADTPTSGEPGNPSNGDHSQPVLRVILNVLHGAVTTHLKLFKLQMKPSWKRPERSKAMVGISVLIALRITHGWIFTRQG